MENNPVGWFEIYVDDMDRARVFYQSVFEVELQHIEVPGLEMWAFPMLEDKHGSAGALIEMDGVQAGGGGTLVYFSCEDCSKIEARVEKFGGSIDRSKYSIGESGFMSLVVDTEGNMIGLHSLQ